MNARYFSLLLLPFAWMALAEETFFPDRSVAAAADTKEKLLEKPTLVNPQYFLAVSRGKKRDPFEAPSPFEARSLAEDLPVEKRGQGGAFHGLRGKKSQAESFKRTFFYPSRGKKLLKGLEFEDVPAASAYPNARNNDFKRVEFYGMRGKKTKIATPFAMDVTHRWKKGPSSFQAVRGKKDEGVDFEDSEDLDRDDLPENLSALIYMLSTRRENHGSDDDISFEFGNLTAKQEKCAWPRF